MISKSLQRRIVLDSNQDSNVDKDFELEYYLTESNIENGNIHSNSYVYGVEIVKKENNLLVEKKLFSDISINKEETETIIHKLAGNSVTPMALPYVLDNIIGI